jgi:hypothetical protein
MKNCNKIVNTCDGLKPAQCTEYEGTTNNASKIKEECLKTVEDTTQDIYIQLDELTNLSNLGQSCLTYDLTTDGRKIVKNILKKMELEICTLKTKVTTLETTALCNKSIVACEFDFGTLTNQCNTQPQTFKDVVQLILDNLNP